MLSTDGFYPVETALVTKKQLSGKLEIWHFVLVLLLVIDNFKAIKLDKKIRSGFCLPIV